MGVGDLKPVHPEQLPLDLATAAAALALERGDVGMECFRVSHQMSERGDDLGTTTGRQDRLGPVRCLKFMKQ